MSAAPAFAGIAAKEAWEVAGSSNEINAKLTGVNESVREQVEQVEQVTKSLDDIKRLVRDSSEDTFQLSMQSSRTSVEVETLRDLIARFRL